MAPPMAGTYTGVACCLAITGWPFSCHVVCGGRPRRDLVGMPPTARREYGLVEASEEATAAAAAPEPRHPPETLVTDKLASCKATLRDVGLTACHRPGGMRDNNRAENSHLASRRRERNQQKCQSQVSAHRFVSGHAAIYPTL